MLSSRLLIVETLAEFSRNQAGLFLTLPYNALLNADDGLELLHLLMTRQLQVHS